MLTLVPYNDPILYRPTIPFDFNNPPEDPKVFADELKSALIKFGGLGLSANQVGKPYSAFAIGNDENASVIFNPSITHVSDKLITMEEGCLSIPGLYMKMSRADEVRIRMTDFNGQVSAGKFVGLTARVILHEMCHLRGKPYFEGVSKLKLDRAIARARKYKRNYNYIELAKLGA